MDASLFRRPGAWLPLAMSVAALATVGVHVWLHGAVHEADEGTAAHIFQLLIAGQLPIVAFFAAKWLSRAGGRARAVLGTQAFALAVALLPVWYLNL